MNTNPNEQSLEGRISGTIRTPETTRKLVAEPALVELLPVYENGYAFLKPNSDSGSFDPSASRKYMEAVCAATSVCVYLRDRSTGALALVHIQGKSETDHRVKMQQALSNLNTKRIIPYDLFLDGSIGEPKGSVDAVVFASNPVQRMHGDGVKAIIDELNSQGYNTRMQNGQNVFNLLVDAQGNVHELNLATLKQPERFGQIRAERTGSRAVVCENYSPDNHKLN